MPRSTRAQAVWVGRVEAGGGQTGQRLCKLALLLKSHFRHQGQDEDKGMGYGRNDRALSWKSALHSHQLLAGPWASPFSSPGFRTEELMCSKSPTGGVIATPGSHMHCLINSSPQIPRARNDNALRSSGSERLSDLPKVTQPV